jgi:hypothetical protein
MSTLGYCKDGASGKAMALKRVLCQSIEAERDAEREINFHRSIDNVHVLKLVDFASRYHEKSRSVKEVLLLFPLCERGSLWDAVEAILDKTVYDKNDINAPHPFPVGVATVCILYYS